MKKVLVVLVVLTGLIAFNTKESLYKAENEVLALSKEKDELLDLIDEISVERAEMPSPTRYELAGQIYGVDPCLLEAIEILETGHFTSNIYIFNNNTYGGKVNGEYLYYTSPLESTMELARLLKYHYFNQGLDTLEEIGAVYCPNSEWASKVQEIYDELKWK